MATISTSPPSPTSQRADQELIAADSPLASHISVNPAKMHGEPCFRDTRVPVQTLFDILADGGTVEEFVEGFPPITREQAASVLGLAAMGMLEGLRRL
ncbi:MAG TPA: DUF433 domain-containing protein [Tepidisphaeraceae bacterium]|nr:DUF433 domain-containing protein [Tepidisphaeraceae bacterium]